MAPGARSLSRKERGFAEAGRDAANS